MTTDVASLEDDLYGSARPPLIMIVDDVEENHKVLGNILRKRGYKITPAVDGENALEILQAVKPDLILMDIMMPGINGFQLCKQVKAMPGGENIPIIFLTVKNEIENILEGFAAGAGDYVTKPFNSAELLARINTHLQLKRLVDREAVIIQRLKSSLAKVRTLAGLLPICSSCATDLKHAQYWRYLEEKIAGQPKHHENEPFSKNRCPVCLGNTGETLIRENVNYGER